MANDCIASFKARIQNGPIASDPVSSFNGSYIKEILAKEFECNYSESGVYKLLARLGFSKIKPRPRHEKNDMKLMEKWKEEILPSAYKDTQAKNPGKKIEIWFQDEMRFGEKTDLSSQWKVTGTSYVELKQLGYRNQYIFGAIDPSSGKHVGLVTNGISVEIMNIHLELISKEIPSDSHAILIMDQAGWHIKAKGLAVPKNLTILSLPPYSPELNPVERLWKWLKARYLKNRFISKDDDLTEIGCEVWNQLDKKIVKSLCQVSFTNFL